MIKKVNNEITYDIGDSVSLDMLFLKSSFNKVYDMDDEKEFNDFYNDYEICESILDHYDLWYFKYESNFTIAYETLFGRLIDYGGCAGNYWNGGRYCSISHDDGETIPLKGEKQ